MTLFYNAKDGAEIIKASDSAIVDLLFSILDKPLKTYILDRISQKMMTRNDDNLRMMYKFFKFQVVQDIEFLTETQN